MAGTEVAGKCNGTSTYPLFKLYILEIYLL